VKATAANTPAPDATRENLPIFRKATSIVVTFLSLPGVRRIAAGLE
jgi:hypothetical protein